MATNLAIDQALLERALALGGGHTKRQTVNRALAEFIARREQKNLLELIGKPEWDTGFDHKKARQRG